MRYFAKVYIIKSCGISAYEVFQFLVLLAAKVTSMFSALTRPERVKVLVRMIPWLNVTVAGRWNFSPGYMTI